MPFVVIYNSGFALNNNPPPSTGGGMPNRMLPLMGVGLLPGLMAKLLPPINSTRWVPEAGL